MRKPPNKLEILLIEDSPADVNIIIEMLTETKLDMNITVARDGQQAIDLLLKQDGKQVLDIELLVAVTDS
jgi:CheY-like chemotaxis protein